MTNKQKLEEEFDRKFVVGNNIKCCLPAKGIKQFISQNFTPNSQITGKSEIPIECECGRKWTFNAYFPDYIPKAEVEKLIKNADKDVLFGTESNNIKNWYIRKLNQLKG